MRKIGNNEKKAGSIIIIIIIVLSSMLIILPSRVPDASGYSTPDAGVTWTLDDLELDAGPTVITSPPGPGGPYTFHEAVTISPSDTLQIHGNLTCLFDPLGASIYLYARGSLDIDGLGGDVLFTSNSSSPSPGDWGGIIYNNSWGGWNQISYATIEYAFNGVYANDSMIPIIQHSNIHLCQEYGIYYNFIMGGPMITNCDIGWNKIGICSINSSTMMGFSGDENHIHNNTWYGIYGEGMGVGSDYNVIENNLIAGIYGNNWSSQIAHCDISGSQYGIYILGPMSPYTYSNDIFGCEYGLYVLGPLDIWSYFNTLNIWDIVFDGIHFESVDLTENMHDVMISNCGQYGIYGMSSNFTVANSSVSGSGKYDFNLTQDSHVISLNTSFNKAKVIIPDAQSNLTVNWFMHVKVVNSSNLPVENADLWVNDTYDNNLFYDQTPADGWIRLITVTEYMENQTGKFYYTPHNVSAKEGTRFSYEIVGMEVSKEVIIVLDGIKFSMHLRKGWNMISVPINTTVTELEQTLTYIDGNYITVYSYNASDSIDKWKLYNIYKASGNDMLSIDRFIGFWIKMESDDELYVVGSEPVPQTTYIKLEAGWNFVGYPSSKVRTAGTGPGEAFEWISGFVNVVQYYNASDSSDPWKEWGPSTPGDLIEVKPGNGLWIYVTQSCTWTVDWS